MPSSESAAPDSSPHAGNGEAVLSTDAYRPNTWEIAFVQDCNLRCGYCCTGFGRFGKASKSMQAEVWRPLSDLILRMSGAHREIHVAFASGETFLHFHEAMLFVDHLRHLAADKQIQIDVQVITNGTLATEAQLQMCLERRISLCFSVDGPASHHDAFRKSSDGKATHRVALKNWRRYRELAGGVADAPVCSAYSVIAGDARLRDIAQFWRQQGLAQFKAIPAEPSKHLGCFRLSDWQTRRARYLEDLEELAFSEATRLKGRDLATESEGPQALLSSWRRLSTAAPYQACGAGYSIIAIDADGNLYPCQGFMGFPERSIGDVRSGVVPAKLAEFRSARSKVQSPCGECWARFLCDGGCCASDPKTGVVLDAWGECDFFRAHSEIAIKSHQHWRKCAVEAESLKAQREGAADVRHGSA